MTRPRPSRPRAVAIALVAFSSLFAPRGALADGMTLATATELARKNNERADTAELRVEVAEGQVESARGAFLPSLTLGATGNGNVRADRNGNNFSGNASLTLRQPLLRPSAIPQYRASKFNLDAAKSGASSDLLTLEYDTATAFLAVVEAQRVLEAAESRLSRATEELNDVQARVDAELNSSNDATRAKLQVNAARRQVTTSEANLGQARLALSLLVGVEITEKVDDATGIVHDAEAFVGVTADLSKDAKTNRPDLDALHQQTLAARATADEPLYRLIPSIDLQMQFTANPNPAAGLPWDQETASLTLTWTIFDGAVRYGDKRTRDAQAQQAERNEHLLERTIDTAVKTSMVTIAATQKNALEAKKGVDIAKANSEETEILYKQGLAKAIELTDANGSLFDAEVAYAQAELDLARAYLGLRRALGLTAAGSEMVGK